MATRGKQKDNLSEQIENAVLAVVTGGRPGTKQSHVHWEKTMIMKPLNTRQDTPVGVRIRTLQFLSGRLFRCICNNVVKQENTICR